MTSRNAKNILPNLLQKDPCLYRNNRKTNGRSPSHHELLTTGYQLLLVDKPLFTLWFTNKTPHTFQMLQRDNNEYICLNLSHIKSAYKLRMGKP